MNKIICPFLKKMEDVETLKVGNTTITAQNISIMGVGRDAVCLCREKYIYWVDIQTSRNIINSDGVVDVVYHCQRYPCSPSEYDKFKKELNE